MLWGTISNIKNGNAKKMRITKTKLKNKEKKKIAKIIDDFIKVNDFTLATDFAEDAYSLFKVTSSKRKEFKSFWELFMDIKELYTKFKVFDLMKNVKFYGQIKAFFRYFIISKLFKELNKLDPMDALKSFLKMFKPKQKQQQQSRQKPKQKPKQQQKKGKGKKEKRGGNKGGEKKKDKKYKSKKSKDKHGTSAEPDSLPIDMSKFKKQMPKIEKTLDCGLMDKNDFQKYLKKYAGVAHRDIKIENIVDIIAKIADKLKDKEISIFKVARVKELTETYKREQEIKSVPYPDNEMNIKKISNYNDILRILPTQYAYDDNIFIQKLAKKDLLIRDYQTRRLKKQALYMLVDVSYSMNGKRNIYASGVALALVRQALSEGSTYFLRFFDNSPHKLHKVKTKKEAEKVINMLVRKPFSGGGTDIQRAIEQAVKDIINNPDKFEKSEIMVISDGESSVDMDKNKLKKQGIKVHSTMIDGRNEDLKEISESYIELKDKDIEIG